MKLKSQRFSWGSMIMNRYGRSLLGVGIIAASFVMPSIVQAQDDFYAHYNRYLYHHLNTSPRSMAMGGTYTGFRDTDTALRGNPAALGWVKDNYLQLHGFYSEVSSGVSFDDPVVPPNTGYTSAKAEMWSPGIGFAMPYDFGGFGLTYNYRDDDIDSDSAQLHTQSMGLSGGLERHDASIGGAYKVTELMSIGLRYAYTDWDADFNTMVTGPLPPFVLLNDSQDYQGHKFHFGAQYYVPYYQVTWGLDGYYGFGDQDSSIVGDGDPDSWMIRGGFGWYVHPDYPFMVALDLNFENRDVDGVGFGSEEDLFGVHLGAEYEVYDNLFLRAGYQYEDIDYEQNAAMIFEKPTISGYSAGIGYNYMDRISFDYAFLFSDTGRSDLTHFFGIGYNF